MENLFLLSLLAVIISLVLTPFIKKLALKLKIIDIPKGKRKIHKKPTPLLGGVAIYISFFSVVAFKAGDISRSEWGIILGALIVLIGGIIDDKLELKPYPKLFFQLAASVVLILMGVKVEILSNPFSSMAFLDLGILYIPVTILWVVGITNALNLIDGLDGLAAGIALICSLTILTIAVMKHRIGAAILTAILTGAITGFLPYNFYPASIFLGDAGAQLLGFLLAAISIDGAIKSAAAFSIVAPILIMGIPIFDTVFAIIRRKINGKPILQGDRGHLHHRLLDKGLSQKQAVVVMYLISALLSCIAIIAMQLDTTASYIMLMVVALVIVIISWKCGFFRSNQ